MKNDKRKLIAIVGPTASGKTAVGVKLAKEFSAKGRPASGWNGAEIVSADSRQVFRGLDIGTGKDLAEYGDIKYHLIDICEPEEDFNLFKYLELARAVIEDIFSRGKVPIVVGGTGLYIQALVEGFELEKSETPQNVIPAKAGIQKGTKLDSGSQAPVQNDGYSREQLNNKSIEELQTILKESDIEAYEKLADRQNPHRLIRAIERIQEGLIIEKKKPDFDVLQIGLEWPREELNKRIDKRVDDRFEQGMLEEVEGLLRSGVDPEWLLSLGLEYREITTFLQQIAKLSNCSVAEINNKTIKQYSNEFKLMKDQLKLRSHQYAKRQMTWFKRFPEIVWESEYKKINQVVRDYLNK